MIDYGGGMIFPDSWAYGPPDPPEGPEPCEDCDRDLDECVCEDVLRCSCGLRDEVCVCAGQP